MTKRMFWPSFRAAAGDSRRHRGPHHSPHRPANQSRSKPPLRNRRFEPRPRLREESPVPITVKIGDAKTHLSELLAKVEAGEEVIIARGRDPIAKLTRIRREGDVRAVIDEIRAARAGLPKTTAEELLAWRDEGRRF